MGSNNFYDGASAVGRNKIICRGLEIEQVIEEFTFEDMIFFQIQSRKPTFKERKMLGYYLVSLCEHADTSPSTHPARVVSNVGGDFYASVIAFISGASGKYHFGALERAMQEVDYVTKNIRDIDSYVRSKLEKKELIWGFGHRFHDIDPRVESLLKIVDSLGWNGKNLKTVREIGKALYKLKKKPMNIDGFGAGLLLDMGFPSEIAILFPILGRLSMIARYHLEELKNESHNRFVALVDKCDSGYKSRTVDLERGNVA